jgi:hypothetical protein
MMKPIKGCKQDEVWAHWKRVEKIPENDTGWRGDIRDPLPTNLKWFLAEIEQKTFPRFA